jgi:cytidylate kinase
MPIKIAITGDLGSGKSTVCRALHERYGLQPFSTGTIQRKIAVDMGMTTYDLNKYMETHPEIDQLIDGGLKELSRANDNIAIDSRMAWHFVENTFKVFLTTDETVAAQRIMNDQRGPSEAYADLADAAAHLKARAASENYRYQEKYGVDCYRLSNYDLIIDATEIAPEDTADLIMEAYTRWAEGDHTQYCWVSPRCLYPTRCLSPEEPVDQIATEIRQGVPAPPAEILRSQEMFYIYAGHCQAAAYLRAECALIPCKLIAQGSDFLPDGRSADQFVRDAYRLVIAQAWEEANGFPFFSYPRQ